MNGGVQVKTADGQRLIFGTTGEKLPALIPIYPATASTRVPGSAHTAEEEGGSTSFQISPLARMLADRRSDAFSKTGFETNTRKSDETAVVQGIDRQTAGEVTFAISCSGALSTVHVSFSRMKE